MMLHRLYNSVDELLAPETLTAVTGEPVKYVHCLPRQGGISGSHLLTVETDNGTANARYVLKRMARQWDWVMNSSEDRQCRAVVLWQSGLLDQFQPSIDHAILACAQDGEGWAILMRDVTPALLGSRILTAREIYCLLDALATLHATFWEASEFAEPNLGLCNTMDLLRAFSPAIAQRLPSATSIVPKMVSEGWELLQTMVAPDVADLLRQLVMDPQPLCTALAQYPATLVHGDYRGMNTGIIWHHSPQVILLDWQLSGHSAATIDLIWLVHKPRLKLSPITMEAAIEYYRQRLIQQLGSRFDPEVWQPLLALGMLANILRMGCFTAWHIPHSVDETQRPVLQEMIQMYNHQARMASKWL